eukprot:5201648-Amphidinium_carterae.1
MGQSAPVTWGCEDANRRPNGLHKNTKEATKSVTAELGRPPLFMLRPSQLQWVSNQPPVPTTTLAQAMSHPRCCTYSSYTTT